MLNKFLVVLMRSGQLARQATSRSFQKDIYDSRAAFCFNINNFLSFVYIKF